MGILFSLDSMTYRQLNEADYRFVMTGEIILHFSTLLTLLFHLKYWSKLLLIKNQVKLYAIGFLGLILLDVFLEFGINYLYRCKDYPFEIKSLYLISNCIFFGIFHLAAIGLKTFKMWILETKKRLNAETNAHNSQLALLKSQLNPHFLFNTLNNLYVLNRTRPEEAGEVILGLSDLLRYQLYEGSSETILMSKELAFIKTWLMLEEIRRVHSRFQLTVEGDFTDIRLPPFLFMTFIENALKHGKSEDEILINFTFFKRNKTQIVDFEIGNTKNILSITHPKKEGGLGLNNVKQRLLLLFPLNHSLKIEDSSEKFTVNLTLELT
jgi:LytS/YehU family sensor histidine kinase